MTVKQSFSPRLVRAGLALALALPASTVLAQEAPEEKRQWQVTVGAGVVSLPEYPGSGNDEVRALPLLSARYGRFFLGGVPGAGSNAGLGAYLIENESWTVGAIVSGDVIEPRQESDDARLRGLGDIDSTVRAGVFASYKIGWLILRGSAQSDIADNGQGTIASFDAEATYRPTSRLSLSAGPGVRWADDEYTQTFFGVDAEQAANSDFAQYSASGGADLLRFSLGARYELTQKWSLTARATAARLQGDAADSPIVEDKNQNTFALFVSYRF
jgi:outer membrane protein